MHISVIYLLYLTTVLAVMADVHIGLCVVTTTRNIFMHFFQENAGELVSETIRYVNPHHQHCAFARTSGGPCRSNLLLHVNSNFPDGSGLADTRRSPFWILLELRMPEVVVTTGAIRCAKLQIVTTNKRTPSCFTGRMPFQQCQSTEGKELTHIINNVFPFISPLSLL